MNDNPLLSMMNGNNPMANMMQNNPIMQLVNLFKNGGNGKPIVQKMMGMNNEFCNAINSINGKNQSQVNEMLSNEAKKRGIDLSQVAKQIGMPPEIMKEFGISSE